jgi:hypothetical protein
VLACPRCGGRLRLIATVEDPDAIDATLGALAESEGLVGRAPPPVTALTTSQAAASGPERLPSRPSGRRGLFARVLGRLCPLVPVPVAGQTMP